MLRELTKADWLSLLNLSPELIPPALILRGTRNLRRNYEAHQAKFQDIVHVGSPNGVFEDVFIGTYRGARIGYASVYGAPMASEIVHLFWHARNSARDSDGLLRRASRLARSRRSVRRRRSLLRRRRGPILLAKCANRSRVDFARRMAIFGYSFFH